MSTITSQILRFVNSSKTQKSKCPEKEVLFFLHIHEFIHDILRCIIWERIVFQWWHNLKFFQNGLSLERWFWKEKRGETENILDIVIYGRSIEHTYGFLYGSNRIWVMKGSTEQTTCKCKRGICGVINIYYNKNCATCSEIILEFTYMTCFCRRKLFSYIEYINHQLLP